MEQPPETHPITTTHTRPHPSFTKDVQLNCDDISSFGHVPITSRDFPITQHNLAARNTIILNVAGYQTVYLISIISTMFLDRHIVRTLCGGVGQCAEHSQCVHAA